MHFCSISNVQLLQPSREPGHAHGHTDTLVHRWGRRPFHATQQRGPQTHVQQRNTSQRPDVDRDECLSLPAARPHCCRMTEKRHCGHSHCTLRGTDPLQRPLSWYYLCLRLSFQESIWLCLGWSWLRHMLDVAGPVHLAVPGLQCVPSLIPLPAAPGHLHTLWWEWGWWAWQGMGVGTVSALWCLGQMSPPQTYATTWHLCPPAGRELPLLGHCASMADGHVCQLPRDLREAPNRSAFLEGRTFSPFLLLLNAEPVDKTIYQVLL